MNCTTISLLSLLDLPLLISIKLCFNGSLLSPTVTWHRQKENYSTNARLHYARNEDQHSNYIKNKRLTKQFRKTSTERIKSQTQALIHSCFRRKINILKIQCFKVHIKNPFSENTLLKSSKAPFGTPQLLEISHPLH